MGRSRSSLWVMISLSVLKTPVVEWQIEKVQFVALQASTLEISWGAGNVGLKIL